MNRQKIIDLLAMSRFANLPTVWSNGLLGVILGWSIFRSQADLNPLSLALIGLALSCLYLGGCFFNDWHDVEFDENTRPDRPIPSGRWKRKTILLFSVTLMCGGLVLSTLASLPSAVFSLCIIICILVYTRWHKAHPASFLAMAGARAFIYPAAAFSLLSWNDWMAPKYPPSSFFFIWVGLALGLYILGISLTARSETSATPGSDSKKVIPVLCLCAPVVIISAPFLLLMKNGWALPPFILFVGIIGFCVRRLRSTHQVGTFVSRTLAAIPLVDFLFIFPLLTVATKDPLLLFLSPALALAALALQKIAPAT